jgi:hypothetical protein
MKLRFFVSGWVLVLLCCTPSRTIPSPLPVTPVEAGDGAAGDCEVEMAITNGRMIALDGGKPLVVPCP